MVPETRPVAAANSAISAGRRNDSLSQCLAIARTFMAGPLRRGRRPPVARLPIFALFLGLRERANSPGVPNPTPRIVSKRWRRIRSEGPDMTKADLSQYQVLLVDDEPFIRQLTGML